MAAMRTRSWAACCALLVLADVALAANLARAGKESQNGAAIAVSGNAQSQQSSSEIAVAVGLRGADVVTARGSVTKGGRSLGFRHTLRVCNAYPSDDEVEIYQGKEKITEAPMAYKDCQEFSKTQLHSGQKLLFKVGDVSQGSFVVSDLPRKDAVLMLVIFRHDQNSKAAAFESHVFANLVNAQIAVLDTYQGSKKAEPRIKDAQEAKTARDEQLRYDSVVAVNPGVYDVVLKESENAVVDKGELVALNRESYLVLRVGVESRNADDDYPQELVVFPHSDKKTLVGEDERSGAARVGSSLLAMALLLAFGTA